MVRSGSRRLGSGRRFASKIDAQTPTAPARKERTDMNVQRFVWSAVLRRTINVMMRTELPC